MLLGLLSSLVICRIIFIVLRSEPHPRYNRPDRTDVLGFNNLPKKHNKVNSLKCYLKIKRTQDQTSVDIIT